ncbi:adenylosuccinate lyase [Caldivirga sp. UBA161]|uniref:adenylosuccinate lyase n=1 Tax=Caldivirga sp. UBA161 TaxID=1915569 RepID=UPI0025C0844D|nr:adenylosuccinate lyase [Caldivirga sp. UBA161]
MDLLSPLDARYRNELKGYHEVASEEAFITYRAKVELLYLEFLIDKLSSIGLVKPINDEERWRLRGVRLSDGDVNEVRRLEDELGHDVKAIEYVLRGKLKAIGLEHYAHLIHLGLTSEDVNNLAMGIMLKRMLYEYLIPSLVDLGRVLVALINKYADTPMIARTHGQPATPTTFGKEMAYHAYRLCSWISSLINLKINGKVAGASGSMASFTMIAQLDWPRELMNFVSSLNLEPTPVSTQILPPDNLTHILAMVSLTSYSLINLAQDVWMYSMLGYIRFKGKAIGSSTMPHKVNPVDLENAEGNLKLGSSILMEVSKILQLSRLQRDLSDSTIKRNLGLAIGYVILGLRRLRKFMEGIEVNEDALINDLNNHWEVLSEAVQVRLRALGQADAYEKSLRLFRVPRMSMNDYLNAIKELGVNDELLLNLRPGNYVGYAGVIARNIAESCTKLLNKAEEACIKEREAMSMLGFR